MGITTLSLFLLYALVNIAFRAVFSLTKSTPLNFTESFLFTKNNTGNLSKFDD